jgi:hypothetical protein
MATTESYVSAGENIRWGGDLSHWFGMNSFFLLWLDWWSAFRSGFRFHLAMLGKMRRLYCLAASGEHVAIEDLYEVRDWFNELLFSVSWLEFCLYGIWKLCLLAAGMKMEAKAFAEERERAILRIKKKRSEITAGGVPQK